MLFISFGRVIRPTGLLLHLQSDLPPAADRPASFVWHTAVCANTARPSIGNGTGRRYNALPKLQVKRRSRPLSNAASATIPRSRVHTRKPGGRIMSKAQVTVSRVIEAKP